MHPIPSEPTGAEHYVPAAWEPVLEDLKAFADLHEKVHGKPDQVITHEQRERLDQLHERLLLCSAALLEPESIKDFTDSEVHRLFAVAVLMLTRLEECVAAGEGVLDTAGSRTLSLYQPDFESSATNRKMLIARLQQVFSIPDDEIQRLQAEIEDELADARRKQAIVEALRQEFGLQRDAPELRAAVFRFFRVLYPEAPLLPEEVELVITGCMIFFCVPFRGEELTTTTFQSRCEADQNAVRQFLRKVNTFRQKQFAHFPVFGFLRGETLDRTVLERVAARARLSPGEVAHEISRMTTILPLAGVDEYVVHDVWGHGWQASMLRFEKMYEEMAGFADQLELNEATFLSSGESITFGECFCGNGATLELDDERFTKFALAEVAERLPVALSGVLAEMMADTAEYKFRVLHADKADELPSTSLFKLFPSKLDLTLRDISFYFSQATKTVRLWAEGAKRRQKTRDELVRNGASSSAAEAAIARATALWSDLAAWVYAPQLCWERTPDGRLRVNVMSRVALNFLGIHRAIVEVDRRLDDLRPIGLPLRSFRDLMLIGASVFFEADRAKNLWLVDEYLSLRFIPLCRQLAGRT